MKVLHLSTFDRAGGAARAAYRIHQGLNQIGVTSEMLVRNKSSSDRNVLSPQGNFATIFNKLRADFNKIPLQCYSQVNPSSFSVQWFPDGVHSRVNQLNPDVINLHWINGGHLQLETLGRLKKPLVWTLMDMWSFTGGCHYSDGCDRYEKSCGACPLLKSDREQDLSYKVWWRKANSWQNLNLTIAAPSTWMAKCAAASSLFQDKRIEVIPFGLNLQVYQPLDSQVARKAFNLPQDKHLILFGAIDATQDRRKGFHLLQPALQKLATNYPQEQIELVVFGASAPEKQVNLGFNVHYLGSLKDNITLALAYSAADVMIVPSIEEAFGQTASEALACGTPVVGFDGTGVMDIVDHQQNGYLVKPYEIDDLAAGIAWILDHPQGLSTNARTKAVQEFDFKLQAKRYQSLYQEIIS